MTLDEILQPHGEAHFLANAFGRTALHASGSKNRFDQLFSWEALNHLLEYGGLGYPRLRLTNAGRDLAEDVYLAPGLTGYRRPMVSGLNSALRDGARIFVESAEELCEPLSELCESLERDLQLPVAADVHASCQSGAGGELQHAEQDCLVVQVSGCGGWSLYVPSDSEVRSAAAALVSASPEAAWRGTVSEGDVLYVPSGWSYTNPSRDGPSLFVAVRFRRPSATEFLEYFLQRLKICSPLAGSRCPDLWELLEQSNFLEIFQAEAGRVLTQPGLLLGFLKDWRSCAPMRGHFSLPYAAMRSRWSPGFGSTVKPLVRFPKIDGYRWAEDDYGIALRVDGKLVRLSTDAAMLLDTVFSSESATVQSVAAACANALTEDRVVELIAEMVGLGVLVIQSG